MRFSNAEDEDGVFFFRHRRVRSQAGALAPEAVKASQLILCVRNAPFGGQVKCLRVFAR